MTTDRSESKRKVRFGFLAAIAVLYIGAAYLYYRFQPSALEAIARQKVSAVRSKTLDSIFAYGEYIKKNGEYETVTTESLIRFFSENPIRDPFAIDKSAEVNVTEDRIDIVFSAPNRQSDRDVKVVYDPTNGALSDGVFVLRITYSQDYRALVMNARRAVKGRDKAAER